MGSGQRDSCGGIVGRAVAIQLGMTEAMMGRWGALTAVGAVLALAACKDDGTVVVYEFGPHLAQCSPPAITLAGSAAKLTDAGIQVLQSSCGFLEGVAFPAVCGAGTGELLLHDIPAASVVAAEAAGFVRASTISGEGWRRGNCPDYLPVIELAQQTAACAQIRNRVIQIQDALHPYGRMMLLDQAGNCADAGYRQILFGETVNVQLCSNADSIAGSQKSCSATGRAAMFDTVLANLDEEDLGLGSGYHIRLVYSGT
jgi:hypothetical protein